MDRPLVLRVLRDSAVNAVSRGALALALCALTSLAIGAATVAPPPDPGLEASLRGADAIADLEILAGGPFRCCAAVRRVFKGALPPVVELEAYNTFNGDAAHGGFPAGGRWIVFLSRTDRPDVFALLTPSAPRLPVGAEGVLLSLGDPPFRIPVPQAALEQALTAVVEREESGATPEGAPALIRALWEKPEVEPRYLAVALAGLLREPRALPVLAEAARDSKLLRLRLTAAEALRKVGTPEACALLRGMLTDERDTVAREAAASLIELKDVASLPVLLDWAQRAAEAQAKLPAEDSRRDKAAVVLNQLFLLLLDVGPLRPVESLAPGLLTLARGPDSNAAASALFVLDRVGGAAEVDKLLLFAADPAYANTRAAEISLFRATLQPTDDLERFYAWWRAARASFGEATKSSAIRNAVLALTLGADEEGGAAPLSVLLAAPGELALPEAAGFLLNARTAELFETRHLALWRTPLALPFYLERLGSPDDDDRRYAVQGLALLARNHPRLRDVLRPFIRAALADPEPLVRRIAVSACGWLDDAGAFPLLLEPLRGAGGYEMTEAARAVFEISARTLGYSPYELEEDNEKALRGLASWWEGLGARRARWTSPLAVLPARQVLGMGGDELERLCMGPGAQAAGAAFAILFAGRRARDPLWARLLAAPRALDRAHGILGLCGGTDAPTPELAQSLSATGAGADLVRATGLFTLASLKGGRGPDLVVEWLEGAGAAADPPWRRLAAAALGMADGEPRSLAFLSRSLDSALAAEDALDDRPPPAGLLPTRPLLTALAARADGVAALTKALASSSEPVRELALRALAARRHLPAVSKMLEAIGRAERFTVYDLARAAAPLLSAADAPQLAAMLMSMEDSARLGAAMMLAERPELGGDPATRGALIAALRDFASAVRTYAAEALGKLRARSAVPSLVALLNDYSTDARGAAITALGLIGDPDGVAAAAQEAQRSYRVNPRWLRALALHGDPRDLELLITASRSESWVEQRAAVEALGACARTEALTRLLAVFRDEQSPYQTAAGDALALRAGEVDPRGPPAGTVLAALAGDLQAARPADRARTVYWLARLPASAAAEPLLKALADPEAPIRQLADWALRRVTGKDAGFDAQAPPK